MSVVTYVLLTPDRLPTTAAWQAELTASQFAVTLDPGCEAMSHEGFWPAELKGRPAGFEFSLGEASELFESFPDLPRDHPGVVSFTTHSSLDELVSAVAAAAVLTTLVGGVLVDESSGTVVQASGALEWARATEHEAGT